MKSQDVYKIFTNANAILTGHFKLSSGLHSDTFIQCAKVLEKPDDAHKVASLLIEKLQPYLPVDYIISPAVGGLIIGYEVARQIHTSFLFCERINGMFTMQKRGFAINPDSTCIVIEDVVTTAGTSVEMIHYLQASSQNLKVLAEGCLIDRSAGLAAKNLNDVPLHSVLELKLDTFTDNNIPDRLKNIPVQVPGTKQRVNEN